jgi:hypothetical protein
MYVNTRATVMPIDLHADVPASTYWPNITARQRHGAMMLMRD